MSYTPVVEELYAAFGRGDIPAILERLHPDVAWLTNVDFQLPAARAVPCYEPRRGREAVARYFNLFALSYEVHEFRVASIMEGATEVTVRLDVDVTLRRTGRRVKGEVFHHYTFDEAGMVTRFLDVEDTLGFATAWA